MAEGKRMGFWQRRAAKRAASKALYPSGVGRIVVVPTLGTTDDGKNKAITENPFLYPPVFEVALRIGALPIKVKRYSVDDDGVAVKTDAADHPAYTVLRKPNPTLTRNLLISGTVQSMLLNTTAAWLKTRVNGELVEVWPVDVRYLTPVRDTRSLISEWELQVPGQPKVTVPFNDLCYFRLVPAPDDWAAGASEVASLTELAKMGGAAIEGGEDMFSNATFGRSWIDLHGKTLTEKALERLQAQMELARGRRYGTPVMEDGATMESMGGQVDNAVLVSSMEQANVLIRQALGTDAEDDIAFLTTVVQPIADAIEQELERSFFTEWPTDPAFAEFGFREAMKGDPLKQAQYHQTLIFSGQETLNEARAERDKGPIPGGDKTYLPLNVDEVGAEPSAPSEQKGTSGGMGGAEGQDEELPTAQTGAQRVGKFYYEDLPGSG